MARAQAGDIVMTVGARCDRFGARVCWSPWKSVTVASRRSRKEADESLVSRRHSPRAPKAPRSRARLRAQHAAGEKQVEARNLESCRLNLPSLSPRSLCGGEGFGKSVEAPQTGSPADWCCL